jgi:hypothetical protein
VIFGGSSRFGDWSAFAVGQDGKGLSKAGQSLAGTVT